MASSCEELDSTVFQPFNDTSEPRVQKLVIEDTLASGAMDTTVIDPFRQGVNIRTAKHRFAGMTPKMWAGNTCHYTNVTTIGQARDFTEYEETALFEEVPEFSPLWYIVSQSTYPYPIVFNGGPQEQEEAIIEPFVIPFRQPTTFIRYYPNSVKGNFGDGNELDGLGRGNSVITQFIDYNVPRDARFFLDEGGEYFGGNIGTLIADPTSVKLTTANDPDALFTLDDTLEDNINGIFLATSASSGGTTNEFVFGDGPINNTEYQIEVGAGVFETGSFVFADPYSTGKFLHYDANNTPNPFQTTGSISIELFFNPDLSGIVSGSSTDRYYFFNVSTNASGEANNILYSLYWRPGLHDFIYQHQSGSAKTLESIPIDWDQLTHLSSSDWNHLVFERTENASNYDINLYVNNVLLAATSSETKATGGSSSDFWLGRSSAANSNASTLYIFNGRMSSFKLYQEGSVGASNIAASYDILKKVTISAPVDTVAITTEGFSSFLTRSIDPYDDTAIEEIVDRINTTNTDLITVLKTGDVNLDSDIRETYNQKSATAGYDVYSPEGARYGTDSIAFNGRFRGA